MSRVLRLGSVIAAFLAMASASGAQTATGQITGSVRDSSGAVMPKVKVVVTNQQTGLTRETTSNDVGDYVVPLLPVGVYLVTAEQKGFKVAVRSDLPLNVDQVQRVDLQLDAGDVSERVEVTSSAVALDTASATVGQTITEKQVTELPLNGRNFLQLLFLGAGAVETTGEQGAMRQGVGNAISIMGCPADLQQLHDRRHVEHRHGAGHACRVLSVDAIQEFKEQTTTYSAEYGFSSNQINIVSKTGTNVFHGTGFDFIRNEKLDAKNFFDPANADKPKLDQKQFGFVVGGPVLLPFYNGRNKTFFLVNYEGTRIERGFSSFYTVPTPDQLAGRFATHDHRPADRPAVPKQHDPAGALLTPRAARVEKRVVPDAQQQRRRKATISWSAHCPRTPDQFTVAAIRISARLGRVFGRFTKTTVRQPDELEPAGHR